MNQIQLECRSKTSYGTDVPSHVTLLPSEMMALDGKSAKVDGEVIRFKLWNGCRVYVNQRKWTLGYFSLETWDLSWGRPEVAQLQKFHGNECSPKVAEAVKMILGIDEIRLVEYAG